MNECYDIELRLHSALRASFPVWCSILTLPVYLQWCLHRASLAGFWRKVVRPVLPHDLAVATLLFNLDLPRNNEDTERHEVSD